MRLLGPFTTCMCLLEEVGDDRRPADVEKKWIQDMAANFPLLNVSGNPMPKPRKHVLQTIIAPLRLELRSSDDET